MKIHRSGSATSGWAALVLLGIGSACAAGPIQWPTDVGGNAHYYDLVLPTSPAGNYNWFAARDAAANMTYLGSAGQLVTITSASEENFLKSNFESMLAYDTLSPRVYGDYAWIGLNDQATEGVYQWVTGEPFAYSNWAPPEPNNLGNEDFVWLWRRDYGSGPLWSWNDAGAFPSTDSPGARIGYLVEFAGPFSSPVPGPSSFAIVITGTAVLGFFGAFRKRRSSRFSGSIVREAGCAD